MVVVWTVDDESEPDVSAAGADSLETGRGVGVAGMNKDLAGKIR